MAPREVDDLARRISLGDPMAEEEFASRFCERIRVMMLVRTHRRDLAEDLAQEALIAALRSLRAGHLRDPSHLPAFVHGTARNVLKNWLRTRGRHPVEVALPRDLPVLPPPDRLESAERRTLVSAAIARLDRTDREILRLYLVGGLDAAAIATTLTLRAENIRAHKSRALRRLVGDVSEDRRAGGASSQRRHEKGPALSPRAAVHRRPA